MIEFENREGRLSDMPSTYAHYRLGQEVLKEIPDDLKQIIIKNKTLYDIWLHGPDILFYYHPLKMNNVNSIGYQMHEHTGKEFLEYAKEIIHHDEKAIAYIFGFICHFALDASCHGYIDQKIATSHISHTEIEVEFDRYLMIKDGWNPIYHQLTNHIVSTPLQGKVIAPFFKGTTPKQIEKALQEMKTYNHLLIAPTKLKRKLIYALLHITGNYQEMHGLLVNYQANPDCQDSTEKLSELYEIAKKRAIQLIEEYHQYILDKALLNDFYDYTFSGKKEQKNEV